MAFSIPESAFIVCVSNSQWPNPYDVQDDDDVEHVVVLGSHLRITDSCDNREYSLIVSVVIIIKHFSARCRF